MIKIIIIKNLGFAAQTDFLKLKAFIKAILSDNEFLNMQYSEMARDLKRTGTYITRQTVAEYFKKLDKLRADLGSVQNQLVATINNITVTQVNVKSAESQIRDVDFASESANFSKFNILAQSGSYAMSQANAVQQNILRLLQ